jgi:hypothetical protein
VPNIVASRRGSAPLPAESARRRRSSSIQIAVRQCLRVRESSRICRTKDIRSMSRLLSLRDSESNREEKIKIENIIDRLNLMQMTNDV